MFNDVNVGLISVIDIFFFYRESLIRMFSKINKVNFDFYILFYLIIFKS